MTMGELIKQIKQVESDIQTLGNLKSDLSSRPETERCAGISCRGSWSVYFTPAEVADQLQRRWDGLHVQLNRLLEAKKAAEITIEGWLNASSGGGVK